MFKKISKSGIAMHQECSRSGQGRTRLSNVPEESRGGPGPNVQKSGQGQTKVFKCTRRGRKKVKAIKGLSNASEHNRRSRL